MYLAKAVLLFIFYSHTVLLCNQVTDYSELCDRMRQSANLWSIKVMMFFFFVIQNKTEKRES